MGRLDQEKAARLLSTDVRRSVYEGGDFSGRGSGRFYVDWSQGASPELTKADVEQMVRDGILVRDPECDGLYRRGPKL